MEKFKSFMQCLGSIFFVCGTLMGCHSIPVQKVSVQNISLQGRGSQKIEKQATVSQTVSDRVVNRPSDQTALKKPSKIFYQNSLYSHHLTVLQNNFSIRTDTQLCGVTRALSIEIGVRNYPQPLMTGDKCVQNACFDTQTGTYITADGTRSVCR
ncbi:MAG: hypothetical protein IIT88_00975 [Acetobacter sp.]|nr:hypothetical protein [Acetobacter sp.]